MVQVYRHRTIDTKEVFYIGIAKTKHRPYTEKSRNKYWKNVVNKHGFYAEIIANVDDWDKACELEELLISEYGRRDIETGCLVNMTDGGDGTCGIIFTEDHRKHLSISIKGREVSNETRNKISNSLKGKPSGMRGKKMTDDHKLKIGKANKISLRGNKSPMKGKKHTDEAKKIIGQKATGRVPHNKGKQVPLETKEKIRLSLLNKNGKKVIHIDSGREFGSLKYACFKLDMNYSTEANRINRKSKKVNFIVQEL